MWSACYFYSDEWGWGSCIDMGLMGFSILSRLFLYHLATMKV